MQNATNQYENLKMEIGEINDAQGKVPDEFKNRLFDIERQLSACWTTIRSLLAESEKTETREWKISDQMTPPEDPSKN